MLYEMRTYHAIPGRLPDLNRRFADITMGYFKQYGIQVVGFWTNERRPREEVERLRLRQGASRQVRRDGEEWAARGPPDRADAPAHRLLAPAVAVGAARRVSREADARIPPRRL